jgi:putative spermidine/putrescine transport system permease protein
MRNRIAPVWVWLLTIVCGAILAAPTLILIPMSFSTSKSLSFPPRGFTLEWYANFFHDSAWTTAARVSLVVGLCTSVLAIVLGVPLAMSLVRSRYRGVGGVSALVLGPAVIPAVIMGIGMYQAFSKLGLVRTIPGLIVAHTVLALPLVVVTLVAGFQSLDRNLELAANNLGAGPVRTFVHAMLPPMLPSIAIAAVYGFVTSWDEMIVSLFLTGPQLSTLPVQMWNQVRNEADPTTVAVSTMLVTLSTVVIVAVFVVSKIGSRKGPQT